MKFKTFIFCIAVVLFSSCALRPISSEYTFVKTNVENITTNNLGDGTILIYNGADILHKIDNTARLNIWIDDKALGQIKPREYVIINLKEGSHQFKLLHIDVVNMRSTHEVEINGSTKVIKVKPNLTSNKLEVVNELPKKFEKFKYSQN